MARIMVPRADASAFAAPSIQDVPLVRQVPKTEGREGVSTVAAGVSLADQIARSPAIGALLAGLSRLGSNIGPGPEGAGAGAATEATDTLRQEAAKKLMEQKTASMPAIPKDVIGAVEAKAGKPLLEAPEATGPIKADSALKGMGKVWTTPGPIAPKKEDEMEGGMLPSIGKFTGLPPAPFSPPPSGEGEGKMFRTTDPSKLLAMAKRAKTREEQEAIMEMADDADVYGANLLEIATGAHKRRFAKELSDAFPKEPSQYDVLRAENIRSQIATRGKQVQLAQQKAVRDAEQFSQRLAQQSDALNKRLRAAAREGAASRANQRTLQKMREEASEAAREAAAAERRAEEERKKLDKVNKVIGGYQGQEGPLPEETVLKDAQARVEGLRAQAAAAEKDDNIDAPSESEVKQSQKDLDKAKAEYVKAKAKASKSKQDFLEGISPLFPGAGGGSSLSDILDVGAGNFGED